MSNQASREFGRFYNHYAHDAKREIKASYIPDSEFQEHKTLTGVLGTSLPSFTGRFNPYNDSAEMSKRLNANISPDRSHHRKYGIGIQGSHVQRQHLFTDLPGQTFNNNSRAQFTGHATQVNRSTSPLRSMRRQQSGF